MAIPIPKPDLPEVLWSYAIEQMICVHLALGSIDGITIEYQMPSNAGVWKVCEECAAELDRRLLEPCRCCTRYKAVAGIGRVEKDHDSYLYHFID
jgi:hypothetical protein